MPGIKSTSRFTLTLTLCSLYSAVTAAEQDAMQLDEMVVTAAGFSQQLKDAPASITVIDRAQLERKSYRDITDALRDVPGVVITGGGSSTDISLRGMSGKYTLMLVDGRRQDSRATRPNSDHGGIEQGWMPPLAAIERIEVVRGPMSSLYGSDAMGGVINVITRKVTPQWYGNVRGELTAQDRSDSGDANSLDVFAAGPLIGERLGVQLYGQRSRRGEDGFANGFKQQSTDSGTAKLSFKPDDANEINLEGGQSLQTRNAHQGRSSGRDSFNEYERSYFALSHAGRWQNWSSDSYLQRERNGNPGRRMFIDSTTLSANASHLGERHNTTFGGQYLSETLSDAGNQLKSAHVRDRLTRWSWALFVEDEWRLTDDFALTGGLRMDQHQNYGGHWSPRLYGVYHLDSQWSLKGGVSTGYRSPDIRSSVADWGQITGGGVGDPAIIIGNPGLKPETSVSREVALLWDNQEGVGVGVTLYSTQFKNKIATNRICVDSTNRGSGECMIGSTAYKFISERLNVDEAQLQGVETTLDWQLSEAVALKSNYTFTASEQLSGRLKGKPLNEMPRHMFNATVDWQVNDRLGSWTRLNYRGRTSESDGPVTAKKSNPGYAMVDLGGTYKLSRDLKLLAGVYNLFNEEVHYDSHRKVLDGRRYTVGFDWAI